MNNSPVDELMVEEVVPTTQPQSFLRIIFGKLFHSVSFYLGVILIGIILIISLFPKLVTRRDPTNCFIMDSKIHPNKEHLFGTDVQGCDYLAKVVYGGRTSLLIGILVTLGVLIIGIILGTLAGYFNKYVDGVISRFTDVFYAIPTLLGAMVFLTVANAHNVVSISLALILFGWMSAMRLVRSSVMAIRNAEYVQAAEAAGVPTYKILLNHIIPNAISPVIVYATTSIGTFIASEAALTFLGLGIQPPATSWGLQISDAQHYFRVYPYLLVFPAVFLSLTVLGFMLLGDSIRKALDARS